MTSAPNPSAEPLSKIGKLEDLDMPPELIADVRRVDQLDREGKRNEATKLALTLLPRMKAYALEKARRDVLEAEFAKGA